MWLYLFILQYYVYFTCLYMPILFAKTILRCNYFIEYHCKSLYHESLPERNTNFSSYMKTHFKTVPYTLVFRKSGSGLLLFLFFAMLFFCSPVYKAGAQKLTDFNTSRPFLFEEKNGQPISGVCVSQTAMSPGIP